MGTGTNHRMRFTCSKQARVGRLEGEGPMLVVFNAEWLCCWPLWQASFRVKRLPTLLSDGAATRSSKKDALTSKDCRLSGQRAARAQLVTRSEATSTRPQTTQGGKTDCPAVTNGEERKECNLLVNWHE